MFRKKNKAYTCVEINDYVARAIVTNGVDLDNAVLHEKVVSRGIIKESLIQDENDLFELFKDNVAQWGGKNREVRFLVPDPGIMIKNIEHPDNITSDKLKEYVEMELGNSIHLPFKEPIIDVYDQTPDDGVAVMFASNSGDVKKYTNLFLDIKMNPKVADVRQLCILRLVDKLGLLQKDKTYLISNWFINELSLCIYSNGEISFLRYQPISADMTKWEADYVDNEVQLTYQGDIQDYKSLLLEQSFELERVIDFFQFSLNKGEKKVDEIIVTGDNPIIGEIKSYLESTMTIPVVPVTDELVDKHFPGFKAKHSTLLGLHLKEELK